MIRAKKTALYVTVAALTAAMLLASCESMGNGSAGGKAAKGGRVISQNILDNYNCGFEGADGDGGLYWWSDTNWSHKNLLRVSYEEGGQPDSSCGSYYAKALSEGGNKAQCQFAWKDVASIIEGGRTYSYSYYIKVAPESEVKTGTVSLVVNGAVQDWSKVDTATVSPDKKTTLSDKWQLVTGSFVLADPHDQVQFQLTGSEGLSYCIDEFRVAPDESVAQTIEKNIVSLKDAVSSRKGFGRKVYVGGAMTGAEAGDQLYMDLLFKHFNAVTLGNELKMDAMNGYHDGNRTPIGLTTDSLDGREITVPVLDHSRADALLDKIAAWNKANPGKQLKVRGHVLVWHSQAPEWFFHKDYDAAKAYVSKDEMNTRLEWYIKTMLTYYTDKSTPTGKKYGPLFYGWDVVNEAVSDATGSYRTDTESGGDKLSDSTHGSKSSWWHVYGSNEFIINAFRFANKYAPASLELYYNDYNECSPQKVQGIVELLKAVKSADGTRISGMGMQGHYNLDSPSISQLEAAVRAYSEVVPSVMITEFDMKASASFDGKKFDEEYNRQAYRYKAIYDKLVELDKEPGINVEGIVFWGVTDPYSWLQSSSSVGGGANGKQTQCPLLFDGNYKAKPSFWAFADADKLEPAIQTVTVLSGDGKDFSHARPYTIQAGGVKAEFRPVWKDGSIIAKASVTGSPAGTDKLAMFIDDGKGIKSASIAAGQAAGKLLSVDVAGLSVSRDIKIDFRYEHGSEISSFNDFKNKQDSSSKFYAKAEIRPFASVKRGSPSLDFADSTWNKASPVTLQVRNGAKADAEVRMLWDDKALYVLAKVKDSVINTANADAWQQDSLEVFIDENNAKSESYQADDKQYRISCKNVTSFNGEKCIQSNMSSQARLVSGGYEVAASFKWTDIRAKAGLLIGLDLQINDADASGSRTGTLNWYDANGTGYMNPGVFGSVLLVD
ncbi:MAG: endo-1,4-beta-xylanase [Treponema sp.]|nr:endo-1,4-beta-xylanase [Treponema sp.]